MSKWLVSLIAVAGLLLAGCAQKRGVQRYDDTAFKQSSPLSILVLPPVNDSPDVDASVGFLSQTTRPLAESGYYVFPVAVVQETFRSNGLADSADIHAVKLARLNQIFGADAVLYLRVKKYGASYQVVQSDTRVSADAVLVDAKTGQKLWSGSATASSTENQQQSNGIIGILVSAVLDQVVSSLSDRSHAVAGEAAKRLLGAGKGSGILYGPRSPYYQRGARSVP